MTTPPRDAGASPARPAIGLSVVLPAYNSAAYLDANVGAVLDYFGMAGIDGEVIVADDGSTDGTADSVRQAPNVRVLRLPHAGKGAAVRAGMLAATGETRAFTDADLPYGVELLPLAISYIGERGFHAVIGDRTLPGSSYHDAGILRTILSDVASFTFRTLVTGGVYDTQCGLKAFRGDVADEIFRLTTIRGFAIDVEVIYLLLKHHLDIKRIPVHLERNAPSSVRFVRDSLIAVRDVASIRINLARGRYRSPVLAGMLQADLRAAESRAADLRAAESRTATAGSADARPAGAGSDNGVGKGGSGRPR